MYINTGPTVEEPDSEDDMPPLEGEPCHIWMSHVTYG